MSGMSITFYDGVMAVIVLYSLIHGYVRGAAWQTAPILSLVLGYLVAMPMSVTTAHYFGPPPTNRLFALVTIYLLVSMMVYLMVRQFREGVDKAKLTEYDRHLGAILGLVKGILVTLVTTCVLLIYFPQMRDIILKSESSTIASRIITLIYPILPKSMDDILEPYMKQLGRQLPIDLNNPGMSTNSPFWSGQQPGANPTSGGTSFSLEPTDQDPSPPPNGRQSRPSFDLEPTESANVPPARRPRRTAAASAEEVDPFDAADPERALGRVR